MLLPAKRPVFLVQNEADAALLRRLDAQVSLVTDGPGRVTGDNVVLVAHGGGRDLLLGMCLGFTGRFLDLGANGSLAAYVQGHNDPLGLIDASAHDIYWQEERPLGDWDTPDVPANGQSSGIAFLDPYLRWTLPELVVLVGTYGSGKSSLARLLAYWWADTIGRKIGARASIVGWEDQLWVVKREILRYSLGGDVASLNSAQAKRLADMEARVGWTQRHPDDARLLSWYCELVMHRARRDGVKFFVFDPFNEHDSTRGPKQTETEYVRDVMTMFRRLAHDLGIILIVVTHVAAKSYTENGDVRPFRVANAAGSVQFGNRCDRGICVTRTRSLQSVSTLNAEDYLVVHFDKAKHEESMGRRGTVACVFDPKRMELLEDPGATAAVRGDWS